jgi:hypothetical protein
MTSRSDEEKCPFLYDSCMCSIPEDGEQCPECFNFPDSKEPDGRAKCPHPPSTLAIVKAFMDGKVDDYSIGEVGETEKYIRVEAYIRKDTPCSTCVDFQGACAKWYILRNDTGTPVRPPCYREKPAQGE